MMRLRPTIRLKLALCLAAMMLGGLSGCGLGDSRGGLDDLPTLSDIRTDQSRTQVEPEMGQTSGAQAHPALVSVQRLIVPLNEPTDDLWETVDEQVLSEAAREAWNANGLRIGRVTSDQMQSFVEALDGTVSGPQRQTVLAQQPASLHAGPRMDAPIHVDLSELPGRDEERYTGERGTWRLLGRAQVQGSNVALTLTPHHYRRRASLYPRDPMEAQLDGEVFDAMAVQLGAGGGQLLVIGLHRPWPEQQEQEEDWLSDLGEEHYQAVELEPFEDAQTERAQTEPLLLDQEYFDQQRELDELAPDLDWHMGRAMMTASRAGRPVQTLLLIWAQPVPRSR